ncbi:M23 family metallopeptidase [Arthrobacter sp. DNA4]|jgi:murein DD-endopeptidase MepM/ murein hydrolase activator NlpD|uniref:M23 family metallopeptidase n=1 Tax=Arthrobacter sp. DNA4 TaxID=2963432 RepID=UPI0020CF0D51|nr:M23 family metallopeptidase [Arthrobacter sp. DNA4]UTT70872.1 M23 family metallopeptidase [Arthrobacter sp. DNA4]
MKTSVLLAAFLLLPASIATPGAGLPNSAALSYSAAIPNSAALSYSAAGFGPPAAASQQGSTTTAARAGAAPSWQWPLAPRPRVLRPFDPPPKPWLSGHRGVDLEFTAGTQVLSPAAGTVSFAGVVVDRPVITIDHGGGLRSSFEPVESTLAVGATVARGEVIGTVLPGHCPAAQCLHWGVREGEDYVNPLQFVLDLRPSILLPLSGGP